MIRRDYDTLAAENERLQRNTVHLCSISDEHHELTQTIADLKSTIQDLKGQLAAAKLQVLELSL